MMARVPRVAGRAPWVGGVLACALLAAVALAALPTDAEAARGAKSADRPNIIFIQSDDQARSTVHPEVMPNLFELLKQRGTSFTDYVVTTPLCCPSRATVLSGQYGHNNGVLKNDYGDLRHKRNVLPAWLQRAGYETAHVGKFLNDYESNPHGALAVAPGWDLWFTQLAKHRYYNWRASLNGKLRRFGTRAKDNVIAVVNRKAKAWTRRLAKRRRPFYLQVDHFAPHGSRGPDETCHAAPSPMAQDVGLFADWPLPMPPSFNEADVSDKPNYSTLPLLDDERIATITHRYRCTLEALHGLDRGIGEIYRTVKRAGELNQTVFIFASDNGYFYGEHRIPKGKPLLAPYEENVHMPLTVVVPRRYRGGTERVPESGAPVANIDLAPTILSLADAEPCLTRSRCRTLDGRPLLPLLGGPGGFPAKRPVALEIRDCTYRGVRVDQQVYFEYAKPSEAGCAPDAHEHYDLQADPFQLENLAPAQPGTPAAKDERRLARLTSRLRDCAGIRRRDPVPASGHYCR